MLIKNSSNQLVYEIALKNSMGTIFHFIEVNISKVPENPVSEFSEYTPVLVNFPNI